MSANSSPVVRTIGVAIAIPEPHGSELQDWREHFGDPLARSIPTHVTLLPPTPITEEDLPGVESHLRSIAAGFSPFGILLRGTGTFRPASPVVFVTLAEGISDCELLEQQVRSGPLGHRELEFVYHPHVTVAHHISDEALSHAFEKLAQYEARFTVWGFSLFEHGADGVWRPFLDFAFGS
ncbi:2'-5' RNA ligase family protein [Sporichthya polymorpha]|uniref:2'-5' RNA ligase family protein n=1 Tax=Sporichthya polymorpha TaxID=35751 RepID=UPI00035DEC22|nr:2'-5' RNA ligase family protein [Sporichthya polymorpha]